MKKKVVSLMLVLATTLSMTACGGNTANSGNSGSAGNAGSTSSDTNSVSDGTEAADAGSDAGEAGEDVDTSTMSYEELSAYLYNETLGDFYELYLEAKENDNVSQKYAEMAVAEAKLLESGVMIPTSRNGGTYGISKIAPRSASTVKWGNDSYRYHNVIVATDLISAEDRLELKNMWNELKGTGTYEQSAKDYLTEKGYTLKDTYTFGYSSDPTTWDVLATSQAVNSEAIVNTYDGLMEYDCENELQPALAESYEVSDDGLTYTFHIREGAEWVDSQGRKVADVTADDFVAGMQHMMDVQGGLEYLVDGIIANATEYINGEITDFSEVGVEAVDDYTLVYTLEAPCSYFTTMLGYGVFAPMSRSYYESQGGKFGSDFDDSASDYTYGLTPDNIAYCGPYVVTNATAENTIVFKANESYWNKDNINVKTITWLFNDGSDATKAYNDTLAGTLDGCGLNSSSLELAKGDGNFDTYAIASDTDATSFMAFININRAQFANVADETTAVSTQDEETAARTNAALQNVHFRRALCYSIDRGTYNGQVVGEELKYTSLCNSYVPGDFVSLEEDVTVDINGTATTFAAGTYFGEIVQAQLDADGILFKVWDADNFTGDGFDGWYNTDAAVAELATAVEELAAEGVVVDAENPIHIDYPYYQGSETYSNRANVLKQSIESALGGSVVIDLVACVDAQQWYNAGYFTSVGYECNYDIYDVSGWGPDYGDPSTYLDTFLPDYAGYMTKSIGIY